MELTKLKSVAPPNNPQQWYAALLRQLAVENGLHDSVQFEWYGPYAEFDVEKHVGHVLPDLAPVHQQSWEREEQTVLDYLIYTDDKNLVGLQIQQHEITATVLSGTHAEALTIAEKIGEGLPESPEIEIEDDQVPMSLWMWNAMHNGPNRISELFKVPTWDEIAGNYPAAIRERVNKVMHFTGEDFESGRVILFHGPPGTGKTTAIRALAREWDHWASCQYITDAEAFFANPLYIMQLAMQMDGGHNVLIVEDCGEFITEDGSKRNNQSLARLLNLADGILGQNLNLSIVMTTNEPITDLHPALSRPGRCAAKIEFPSFTETESVDWLRDHGIDANQAEQHSLAELFAVIRETNQV